MNGENPFAHLHFSIGLHAQIEKLVPLEWTIAFYKPSLPPVLSTPWMIALMESAASVAIEPELPPGVITVGTRIEVDHLKAVATGATVRVTARLAGQDGRNLTFEVEARSGEVVIGKGLVFRALVDTKSFHARAAKRSRP